MDEPADLSWRGQRAARAQQASQIKARNARARALKQGRATPLLEPGTRQMTADAAAAIERFLAQRCITKCESASAAVAAPKLPKAAGKKALKKGPTHLAVMRQLARC